MRLCLAAQSGERLLGFTDYVHPNQGVVNAEKDLKKPLVSLVRQPSLLMVKNSMGAVSASEIRAAFDRAIKDAASAEKSTVPSHRLS